MFSRVYIYIYVYLSIVHQQRKMILQITNITESKIQGRISWGSGGSSKVLLGIEPVIPHHSTSCGWPTLSSSNSHLGVGCRQGKCTNLFHGHPGPPMKYGPVKIKRISNMNCINHVTFISRKRCRTITRKLMFIDDMQSVTACSDFVRLALYKLSTSHKLNAV